MSRARYRSPQRFHQWKVEATTADGLTYTRTFRYRDGQTGAEHYARQVAELYPAGAVRVLPFDNGAGA